MLFLIKFTFNVFSILKLKNKGEKIKNEYGNIILHSKVKTPFSFINNMYINSNAWKNKKIETEILLHEQGHIKEKHSIDIITIEVLKILFWFQPMLYLYKKAIQENHEYLADSYCIQKIKNINNYQYIILNYYSEQNKSYEISSSFNYENVKKRFIMMKNTKKGNVNRVVFYTTAFVLTYFSLVGFETKAETINKVENTISNKIENLIENEIVKNDEQNKEQSLILKESFDQKANPKIGFDVFLNNIQDKIDTYYTNQVLDYTVYAFFKINTEGNITDVNIQNTNNNIIKDLITKILTDSPEWNPEIKNGARVESKITIPLRIKSEDVINNISQDPIEIKASPKEGMQAFYQNFVRLIEAPEIGENTEFKTVVKMVVEEDGTLTNFEFINKEGFNEEFNNSVLKVLKTLPKWNPATKDGKPIKTNFNLPITIKIAK